MGEQKKKYTNFVELKEACKKFVQASKDRGAYNGLKNLLTELYPDKAHFVYELLQNAEDQEATEVEFCLGKEKLVFKHNGKKRDFTLEDIDSITNIGNSTKRDDPTTIGQFGVGFKAVYAYTDTPEIHSGEYDFKILDMLVPEDVGVEKRGRKGVTEFVFPFNNENKPSDKAVSEISDTLKSLDETSILFLNNIKRISFVLPNQEHGEISISSNLTDKKFIFAIDKQANEISTRTWWSKFSAKCPISVDGIMRSYSVSIAYKMLKTEERFSVDSSLIGKVCIYFPTDQKSLLHFHINAPFASTVARDNIQYCQENEMLIDTLSDLMVASLYDFRKSKMLDYSVYEALPLQRDFDQQSRYKVFYEKIYEEFETSALFVDEEGEYKEKTQIYNASIDVKKVLPLEYVKKYYGRSWIPSIQPAQRIENFFNQFNIETYTMENFLNKLKEAPSYFDDLFQKNASADYMRHVYYMLSQVKDREPQCNYYTRGLSVGIKKKDILHEVKFILCKDGELHSVSERLFFETDYKPKCICNPIYIDLGKGNKDRTESLKEFFTSLGVQEMTMQLDTMSEIENATDSDDFVIKLWDIIDYYKKNGEVSEFLESAFILARSEDNQLERVKASECCWDSTVHFFYKGETNYIVAMDCYQDLNSDEMQTFKEIFIKLKGKVAPVIYSCNVDWWHPEYKNLNTNREIHKTKKDSDYTITGIDRLQQISQEGLYKEAFLLWETVVKDKNIHHHEAYYQPNQSVAKQEFDSRVAYVLKRVKWIPNKEGVFCRPCEITADELYEGFEYNEDAIFLKNIGFGDITKAPDNVITNLENAGIKVSAVDKELLGATDEEKAAMSRFLKTQREQSKKGKSLTEALADENKDQCDYEEEDDDRDRSIRNPKGRAERQQKDFEAGLKKQVTAKPVWTYTYSNRTSSEEKYFLREQYKGKCQICGCDPIRKYNGDIYFEAINVVSTANLDSKLLNDLGAGWNTLCLCPTCAAEYRYCAKNLDTFEEQVEKTFVEPNNSNYLSIQIQLKGKPVDIRFTPRHFIALKSAFKVYKEHENKN